MSRFSYSIKDSDEVNLALKVSSLRFDLPDKDGSGSPSLMVFISYVLSDHCVDTDRSAERASYKEHIKYVWERCCIHKKHKVDTSFLKNEEKNPNITMGQCTQNKQ